jgi:hypothetical protein
MNISHAERTKLAKDIDRKLRDAKDAFMTEVASKEYTPGRLSQIHQDLAALMQHQMALGSSNNLVLPPIGKPPQPSLQLIKKD